MKPKLISSLFYKQPKMAFLLASQLEQQGEINYCVRSYILISKISLSKSSLLYPDLEDTLSTGRHSMCPSARCWTLQLYEETVCPPLRSRRNLAKKWPAFFPACVANVALGTQTGTASTPQIGKAFGETVGGTAGDGLAPFLPRPP